MYTEWIILNSGKNARGFSATPLESGFGWSTFGMVTACLRRVWVRTGLKLAQGEARRLATPIARGSGMCLPWMIQVEGQRRGVISEAGQRSLRQPLGVVPEEMGDSEARQAVASL